MSGQDNHPGEIFDFLGGIVKQALVQDKIERMMTKNLSIVDVIKIYLMTSIKFKSLLNKELKVKK